MAKDSHYENEILKRLDQINVNIKKLMAVVGVQGREGESQIAALSAAGFTSVEIEQLTGVPAGSIRRRLSESRRQKR